MSKIGDIGIQLLHDMAGEFADRITTGGILVCFASSPRTVSAPWSVEPVSNFGWLPVDPEPRARTGQEYKIEKGTEFESLLQRYLVGTTWVCDFNPSLSRSRVLAVNKNGQAIASHRKCGQGHVVIVPSMLKRDEFLGRFIKEVVPKIAPQLVAAPATEGSPPWLLEWLDKIPGVQNLASDASTLQSQIQELEAKRDEKLLEKQELQRWGDLLWQTGEEVLEERVREALRLMGLNAQKKYGVDVVVEDVQGTLYAEVEGTTKSVRVDKSRKLLEDISGADDPASVRGAIIGNPFRLEQPNDRPVGQRKFFVREVEEAAKKFGWVLITTRELFDLVCRHLAGDNSAARELRNRLLG